ncbi:MAG: arginine--tRNA ligase [Planctomycetota bacterium]
MSDLPQTLSTLVLDAASHALGPDIEVADAMLRPSNDPKFGDYQANLALPLAKQLKQKPRDLAERIAAALGDADGLLAKPAEVAGPGFINLTLADATLRHAATGLNLSGRLGVPADATARHVVVDYCGTNVAKEMLVWHLRSTIIGDALVRVLEALGHRVTRQNHLGDWGTQFGMLIEYLNDLDAPDRIEIGDLNAFYQQAKQKFDDDPDFVERARERVVALQQGHPATRARWRQLVEASVEHFNAVCDRLGVRLTPDDIRGESFYNDQLEPTVAALDAAGLLRQSEGAQVVYPDGFVNQDGEPLPMIVRKSDGGFLYATTDLAAARYRIDELKADRVIYVTDARQSPHFAMVFATLHAAGMAEDIRLEHVPFGTMLGKDRRPYKTRSGESIRLADVLDEAVRRADAAIAEKNPDLPPEVRQDVAEAVGIGAVKYADLSGDRVKDYVFDYDRMLSLEGNTAPYLLYSYARIRSIFRKGEIDFNDFCGDNVAVAEPAERALVLHLLRFGETVAAVGETLEPHRLCNYLYDLATRYHRFFEACPVLKADDAPTRDARLALCRLTARTLDTGLGLLGIRVVERM